MKDYNKQTLKAWGRIVLVLLAALILLAASVGSMLYGKADSNGLYTAAGVANLVGWAFVAWKAYKDSKEPEKPEDE
jgi:MFS superfamily sulfate permease-like transporter